MKYLKPGLYLIAIFLLVFPVLILPRLVKIKQIECYSQYGICSNDLFSKVNFVIGKNYAVSKKEIKKVFVADEAVNKYTFSFRLPAILRIDLVLNKAKFALVNKESGEIFLVDKNGLVLQKVADTNLPKVVVAENLPEVGSQVSEKQLFSLNIVYALNFTDQVGGGEITSDGLMVNLPSGYSVIFPPYGDSQLLLGSLKLVLSRLNQGEGQSRINNTGSIDLRYKNPIIR